MREREDEQDARIEMILGDVESVEFDEAVDRFHERFIKSLKLPCDVTGIEDFRWEEFYVLGPGDRGEYKELKRTQPSYEDTYELLAIEKDAGSEWMMAGDDLGAHVRRKSDGREFVLGLSELKAIGKKSANYQLLDDFAVWFANCR